MEFQGISDLASFISGVGFPICACIFLYMINSKMQNTLNNLSILLQKMTDQLNNVDSRLHQIENDIDDLK